jgi:hypothetical protein
MDRQALYHALKKATRQAFEDLCGHHAGEHFYAFALYSNDVGQYLYPTANTEEALRRQYGRRVDADEEPQLRRFFPGDWRYCQEGAEHFVPVQEILDQFDPYSAAVSDQDVAALAQAEEEEEADRLVNTSVALTKRQAVTRYPPPR